MNAKTRLPPGSSIFCSSFPNPVQYQRNAPKHQIENGQIDKCPQQSPIHCTSPADTAQDSESDPECSHSRRQQPMGNAAGVPWPALFFLCPAKKRLGRDIQHLSQIQQPLRRRKPLAAFPTLPPPDGSLPTAAPAAPERVPWPAAFAGSSSPALPAPLFHPP